MKKLLTNKEIERFMSISKHFDVYPRIKELGFSSKKKYKVSTEEEVLGKLIDKHDILVVAGAFFGDEGKGKTVDAIARNKKVKMAARFNSGQNAGHTVTINKKEYIFHLCPSAIMVKGVTNYIGSECVMDPISFFDEEIKQLVGKVNYEKRLFIDNCHVVTPYHRLMDLLRNLPLNVSKIPVKDLVLNNASTLQGIAPVHASKVNKKGPRLDNIKNASAKRLKVIMRKDMDTFYGMMKSRGLNEKKLLAICNKINAKRKRIPDYIVNMLKAKKPLDYLVELYQKKVRDNKHFPLMKDVQLEINARLNKGEKLLCEASQSFFLSNRIKTFWGSSTSADTTGMGVLISSGINPLKHKVAIINIHKTPGSSRVGRGANPSGFVWQTFYSERCIDSLDELKGVCERFAEIDNQYYDSILDNGMVRQTLYKDPSGQMIPIGITRAVAGAKHFGERGATTKKPRVTGLFDCVLHHKAMLEQGPYTSISALDRADDCKKIGIVIAYVYHHPKNIALTSMDKTYVNGEVVMPGDTIPGENVLKYCQPVIKVIDGWKDSPIASKKGWTPRKGLPDGVHEFIGIIEHFTGAKIISIGNGPEAKDLIYLK